MKAASASTSAALSAAPASNIGCIPSKALLHASDLYTVARLDFPKFGITGTPGVDLAAMMAHKTKVVGELTKGVEFLFKKNKVASLVGEAKITAPGYVTVKTKDGVTELAAKHIVIATGSRTWRRSPALPSTRKRSLSSDRRALAFAAVPKRLLVVGAGVIGLELGSVWRRLGSEVVVVEFLDRIVPGIDTEVAKYFQRTLEKQGLRFMLSKKVVGVEKKAGGLTAIHRTRRRRRA